MCDHRCWINIDARRDRSSPPPGPQAGSAELEPRQRAFLAPAPEDLEEAHRPAAVLASEEPGVARDLALVVVVAGRALRVEALGDERGPLDLTDPAVLARFRRLDNAVPARANLINDVGQVAGLLVERVDEVDGESRLDEPDEEQVREAARLQPVHGAHAVAPRLRQRRAVAPGDVVAHAPGQRRADLEAGREDQAVERVLLAGDDDR